MTARYKQHKISCTRANNSQVERVKYLIKNYRIFISKTLKFYLLTLYAE